VPPEPEPEAPRGRRWFGRRRDGSPEPEPGPEPPSHVELVEVEHAIAPEQVSVAWEAEPAPVGEEPSAGDPWEGGPEPAGVELELVTETEPESEPAVESAAVEPERGVQRPQPARLRRGRR
jgi:hypothetical protein